MQVLEKSSTMPVQDTSRGLAASCEDAGGHWAAAFRVGGPGLSGHIARGSSASQVWEGIQVLDREALKAQALRRRVAANSLEHGGDPLNHGGTGRGNSSFGSL